MKEFTPSTARSWSAAFRPPHRPPVDRRRVAAGRGGGRDRSHAAAAVHQARRSARRSRSLSDGLRPGARLDRRTDGRPALHAATDGGARPTAASSIAEITLHVGYGTFQPVRVERVEDHRLEPRALRDRRARGGARSTAPAPTAAASSPSARRRRARSRPSRAHTTGAIVAGSGDDRPLHLSRASSSAIVGGLLTNFHLPQSSLLMLVSAFAGRERVRARIAKRDRGALPVLQLRRRDADSVSRSLSETR